MSIRRGERLAGACSALALLAVTVQPVIAAGRAAGPAEAGHYERDTRVDRRVRLQPGQDSRGVRLQPDQDSRSVRLQPDQGSPIARQERDERERERAEQQRERAERLRERAEERARERFENLYEQGQDAIERAQWARAVERFSAIVSAKAPRADAAMYWRAYSLDKLNRQIEALTSVAELVKVYPTSRWLGEARALELQVRQRAGQPVSPDAQGDEELKLLAIQGLQHQDPEQAIPMLEKLLQGTQSPRLKERALFVLAQSQSPRARQVLTGIARGEGNPDLQRKAIQYLGTLGSPANRQVLGEIYNSSNDIDVRRQILRGFMMAGDRERVLAAATTEKTPELRAEAVRQLGMMGARNEVWQLYQKETSPEVREQMMQALFLGGDSARLIEIANSDQSAELRRRAVQHLGMMGRERTGDALNAIYARQTDPEIKEAAIDAMFIQQNAESLVALARKETDPDLRRRIVQKLSLMRSPAAREYLMELLK
jgi:HEAT repeat protein